MSNLLDFTQRDVKKFITEFLERIDTSRKYEQQVKDQQKKVKRGEDGEKVKAQQKQIKDVSKFLVPGRQICYC